MPPKTKKFSYEEWQATRKIKSGIADLEPYTIHFPTPPAPELFINYGLPAKEQFFVREEKPEWLDRLNRMKRSEAMAVVKANQYMAEWIDSQWRKRNEGVFMYIKGIPLYIPGKYWFYMNYYYQNTANGVALADFRMPDLEWFWIWCLFVLPNPNIYGIIECTLRRDGKSARSFGEDLEEISKEANVKAGAQSKTDKDAKDTFQEFIVEPWRRLPFFFNPIFDNKTYPSKEINFRSPSTSGESLDASILAEAVMDELGSSIEVRATVDNAFDGRKLRRYTLDEAGKIEEMDVYEAWRIHKQCLRVGQKMVGKAKITTTVEEMVKLGMEPFWRIWDESDRKPEKMTKLNQTVSGLVPIFKPAHEAYIYDEYGFPIADEPTPEQAEYRKTVLIAENRLEEVKQGQHFLGAKELLKMEEESLSGKARQSFLRMYPPSISVARRSNSTECAFPEHQEIIENRLDELRFGQDDVYVGNLEWKDNIQDSEIVWVPCNHRDRAGKVYGDECPRCRFRFFTMDHLRYVNNNSRDSMGYLMPGNKGKGMVSADTFKYANTSGNRKSQAASHGYWEFDLDVDQGRDHVDQVSDDFIFEYLFRPKTPADFCEDMVKVCFWLGWEMFPEINLATVWDYFLARGYENFLKFKKMFKIVDGKYKIEESKTPGMVTLGDQSKLPTFAAVETYLDKNGYKCKARKFLQDCKDVEFSKLTKYDAFVSGSQCLYARSPVQRFKPKVEVKMRTGLDGAFMLKQAGT